MKSVNGVGGWLLVLSRLLILWQPIVIGLTTAQALTAISVRGTAVTLIVLARALAATLGLAAGLALNRRHSGAVRLTQFSLLVSLTVEMFVYVTPTFPNNRGPGETPFWVAGTLFYYGGWLVYLLRSKRVRATFADS